MIGSARQKDSSGGRRKAMIAAVCVGVPAIILLVLFLVFRNWLITGYALRCINKNDYGTARAISSLIGGESSEMLGEYIGLRMEINREYPEMLASFDLDRIQSLQKRARTLADDSADYRALGNEVKSLSDRLSGICRLIKEYENMRADVLDMMDVFAEINRLYTPDESGKNPSFTIGEEFSRVLTWEENCRILSEFSSSVSGGESIYLLSYLVSETYSECEEIRNQLEELRGKGYGDNDPIRVSGSGHKSFPDITGSSGVSLSVDRKEEYERYMYEGICRALTRSLSEYYTGI